MLKIPALQCAVCTDRPSKYRCSTIGCKTRYCSVACFKQHRKDGCVVAQIDDEKRVCGRNKQLSDNSEETATAIPVSTLEKLRDSTKIKSTLSNSRLQQVLGHIDGAKNREKALMLKLDTDPDFASFMDEVMITIGYVKQVNEIPDAVLFHGAPS